MSNKEGFMKTLNYDNNFSVRIKMINGKNLSYITDNIFILDLPKILMSNLADIDSLEPLKLTLRSTKDGSVENEVYNILCKSKFNVEVSLMNPNKVDFLFSNCDVSSVEFSQLAHKSKTNPFNFTIEVKYDYAKYFNSGETFEIGNVPVDILSDMQNVVSSEVEENKE